MSSRQPITRNQALVQLAASVLVAVAGVVNLFSDSLDGWWRLLAVGQVLFGVAWFAGVVRQWRRARGAAGPEA